MWIRFLPSAEGPAWLPPAASWRVSSSFSISDHTRAISGPVAGVLKTKRKKANVRVIAHSLLKGLGRSVRHQASGLPKLRVNPQYTVQAEFLRLTPHRK